MIDDTEELAVYERQGYGGENGFGSNPAIIVVGFINSFADPDQFGGGNIGEAIENTANLLAAARKAGVPIAFTRVVHADDGADAGVFCLKSPNLARLVENAPGSHIVAALSPEPGECVFRKTQPSAFFGTNLAAWPISRGVDTYTELRPGDGGRFHELQLQDHRRNGLRRRSCDGPASREPVRYAAKVCGLDDSGCRYFTPCQTA